MRLRTPLIDVWHFFLLLMVASAGSEEANKSSLGGVLWAATAQYEQGNLLMKAAESLEESAVTGIANEDFDGGFSSLDGMLQWAIGHSDPAKLKETAQNVQQISASELKNRQVEIRELMEKSKMPSDTELMQIAIAHLNNSSLSFEEHHRALQELLILVEVIDNANDLNKLGGLAVLVRELNNPDLEIRLTSAWILGKASQNNPVVQKQIIHLRALTNLVKMIKSSSTEEATKAFYAVSALIRNNLDGQELFFAVGGDLMLQDIMSNSSVDIRLRRKSASLVTDLAECQLENTNKAEYPLFSNRFFLKSVVDLIVSTDIDLQEKALMAVKSLLQLKTTEALDFKDFCCLDDVMERMKEQLQQMMAVECQRDLARDLENLVREVELVFQRKLEKVSSNMT